MPLTYINEYENKDQIDFNEHLHRNETLGASKHSKKKSGATSIKTDTNLMDGEMSDRDHIILQFNDDPLLPANGPSNGKIMANNGSNSTPLGADQKLQDNYTKGIVTDGSMDEDDHYVPQENNNNLDSSISGIQEIKQKLADKLDPILFVKGVPASDFFVIL